MRVLTFFIFVFILMFDNNAFSAVSNTQIPTQMEADSLMYDQGRSVVTAIGHVQVVQANQKLTADKIIYNFAEDFAYAEGNVQITDNSGTVHNADVLELSDEMRKGVINNILTKFEDGSRLWAAKAIRETPKRHVLVDAKYTPCKECKTDPNKTPAWAISSATVTHDKDDATIAYKNATFEAWGVPVFYTPYFSHPDGTVKQKSGFLTPDVQFGSDYGFNAMMPYYWAISPDMDMTAGVRFFSKETPQLNLEMRKRFENSFLKMNASATSSDRVDSVNNKDIYVDDEFRGHVEIDGEWHMNEKWRSGANVSLTTDEQYLDQYNISSADILTNKLYVERFDDRNYASVELLAFQDLRLDEDVDQPNVLPYANMNFIGKPNSSMGGRFEWDTSFLTLYRDGNEQDVSRLSTEIEWQRQDILPIGIVTNLSLSVRGDGYYTADRDISKTDQTEDNSKMDSRFIPTANLEIEYPMYKQLSSSQIMIKPKVGITARPNIDNDSDIANEDSSDAQLDISNLFNKDRFPGLDRVEDRTRINYAIEAGYYTNNGNEFTTSIGQSYRFNNKDNPFSVGSGLDKQSSDIVGEVGASFDSNKHNLNYRFQLDGQKLTPELHELYGATQIYNTKLSAVYLFDKGSRGSEFEESREQLQAGAKYRINDSWAVSASALYDLDKDNTGLRESMIGLSYDNDCFGMTVEYERDLQRESTGATDSSIFMRFRLKNLGEFESSAFSDLVNSEDDK